MTKITHQTVILSERPAPNGAGSDRELRFESKPQTPTQFTWKCTSHPVYHVGIEKIRRAVEEANEQKKVAAKQRDRVASKMGRMDVDYQVLHDAFFKWQTSRRCPVLVLTQCCYHVAAMASS